MKNWGFICVFLLFYSCSVDYEPGDSFINEKNRLVVNRILSPFDPIEVHFYTTFKTDSGYRYSSIFGMNVLMKENEKIIYDGICTDAVLQLNNYPVKGASYSIEVSLAGYDKIYANTSIPYPIECVAIMTFGDDRYSWSQFLAKLSEFRFPGQNQVSLWTTSYKIFESREILQYNEIYTSNVLVDEINKEEGMEVLNEQVGSVYHNGFLWVKSKNLTNLKEIIFTPTHAGIQGQYEPDSKQTQIQIKLIAASKEYDQYNKTYYQQKSMIIYDDDISAIVYQPIQVYSNIKNGLGIFAGMSETDYYFDIPDYSINPDTFSNMVVNKKIVPNKYSYLPKHNI